MNSDLEQDLNNRSIEELEQLLHKVIEVKESLDKLVVKEENE